MSEEVGSARLDATLEAIRAVICSDSTVVEIGSNDASFRSHFAVDSWITVDKFGHPDISVDLNDPNLHLPIPDRSVDVVVCTEVLEHLVMGTPLLREFGRILRQDGSAVVSVPNLASLRGRLKLLVGLPPPMAAAGDCGRPLADSGVLVGEHWVAGHVVDFTEARLVHYLARSGLDVRQHHKLDEYVAGRIRPGGFRVPAWAVRRRLGTYLLVTCSLS